MRCDLCKFWFKIFDENNGYCRRYPPTVITVSAQAYPRAAANSWCGEFQALAPGEKQFVKGKATR